MKRSGKILTTYLAIGGLAVLGVVLFVRSAQAGPITNPGGAPYIKMAVYQGVLSIVPGGSSDGVMEIGNSGRDIAGTQQIYIRPSASSLGTDANNYAEFYIDSGVASLRIPGKLCFGAKGTTNCQTAAGGGASTPTLDQVLAAGNTASGRTAILGSLVKNQRAFGGSSGTSLDTGHYQFFVPYLGSGGYNPQSGDGDAGIFYADAGGLTIAPWSTSTKGIRIDNAGQLQVPLQMYGKSISLGGSAISATPPSATLVVMKNVGSISGGASDTAGFYSNVGHGSAVYAEQQNTLGFAAYFSGASKMVGAPANSTDNTIPKGTVHVVNSAGSSAFIGTAIVAEGSNNGVGYKADGSAAIEAIGGWVTSGKSYGIYVQAGSGSSSNNIAALFRGKTLKTGGYATSLNYAYDVLSGDPEPAGSSKTCSTACTDSGQTCVGVFSGGGTLPCTSQANTYIRYCICM